MFLDILTHFAAGASPCPEPGNFFGIPSWFEYLDRAKYVTIDSSGLCSVDPHFIDHTTGNLDLSSIGLVGLGVVDILLRVGALVAIGFIVYAGFQYITAQGEPEKAKHALGTIINSLVGLGITVVAAAAVRFLGESLGGTGGAGKTSSGVDLSSLPNAAASNTTLLSLYNIVIGLFGSVALLVLIIAGLRYVTSNGDPNTMAKTKNTIIYAAIGLVVSMLAFSIVNYALGHI